MNSFGDVANFVTQAKNLFSAGKIGKDIHDAIVNTAGVSAIGQNNISTAQSATPYSGGDYINTYRPAAIEDQQRDEQFRQAGELFNENINRRTAQQNTLNTLAINDQSNRAAAANNILSAYQNARAANQQFIGSLSGSVGRY